MNCRVVESVRSLLSGASPGAVCVAVYVAVCVAEFGALFGTSFVALSAASLLHVGLVQAEPLRCVDAAGRVTYTDMPCPQAREQREISIVDNASDSAEARREVDASKRSARTAERERPSGAGALTREPTAEELAPLSGSCPAKRRDYEIAVSMITKDLALINRRYRVALQACGPKVDVLPEHERLTGETALRNKRASRGVGYGAGGTNNGYLPPIVTD